MLALMRPLVLLALTFATAVAACGGGKDVSETATWGGPQRPYPKDGVLPVVDFQAYADSLDADWEHDPETLASEFLQVDPAQAGPESPSTTFVSNGSRVTVTRDGLADDSVRSERYVLELERDGDVWSLVSARWEQRCHAGRGHQQFSPALCL
jgi:hypothetical protein